MRMLPKSEIQEYGGKAAILNHIRDNLPDIPIPRYTLFKHGSSLDNVLEDFDSMTKPVIVRSSSPHEYGDFEGIFHSEKDVYDKQDLERAINLVEKSAQSDRAKKYAKQNGFKINDEIHSIIQEESDSRYHGAMMRHPNNPDLIFINQSNQAGRYKNDYQSFLFDERTQSEGDSRGFISHGLEENDAKFLVDKYKEIEGLTSISKDHSLFVEFGYNPFFIYQARPFKKIKTADFEVPYIDIDDKKGEWSDFVFGITPPEGIVLPVLKSVGFNEAVLFGGHPELDNSLKGHDQMLNMFIRESIIINQMGIGDLEQHLNNKLPEWLSINEDMIDRKPYCLLTTSAKNDQYDVDLCAPNMKGLVLGGMQNFLVHNLIRLVKKADLTVGVPTLHVKDFYKNTHSIDSKVRMISNGKAASVMRE